MKDLCAHACPMFNSEKFEEMREMLIRIEERQRTMQETLNGENGIVAKVERHDKTLTWTKGAVAVLAFLWGSLLTYVGLGDGK